MEIPEHMVAPVGLKPVEVDDNARVILEHRFLMPGETPEQRFWAVAVRMASVEAHGQVELVAIDRVADQAIAYYNDLLAPLNFLPNSPAIANVYSDKGCLSACFTLSPGDSIASIYNTSRHAASVIASGGGMGYGLSDIREADAPVNNVQKVACGPVSVLKKFSEDSHMVSQGFRKGANMAQLAVDHPDIFKFIHCKDDHVSLTNFNISVQVTDEFMQAVVEDDDWFTTSRYNDEIVEHMPARKIWNEIIESAHKTGDPGLVFIDRVQETHPLKHLGPIKTSNPCGEEFLESYNSCCLGSINLANHVTDAWGPGSVQRKVVDYQKLTNTVRYAVRFLDSIIETNVYPETGPDGESLFDDMAKRTRRIGLGVMGWADMLAMMGIEYGSERSFNLAEEVMSHINAEAFDCSVALGEEWGVFPEWTNAPSGDRGQPRRNASVTTIAPTGTISRIAGCSSGIEPYYSLVTLSKVLWDETGAKANLIDVVRPIRDAMRGHDETSIKLLTDGIAETSDASIFTKAGALQHLGLDPRAFPTTRDVGPDEHIRMLAAFQKHTSNSVSKTINLNHNASVDDIGLAFIRAWKLGIKAITAYRDGSREVQVLNQVMDLAGIEAPPAKVEIPPVPKMQSVRKQNRPERLPGSTIRKPTGHGTMYVVVNNDDVGRPVECFVTLGKGGNCSNAYTEAIGRLITLALQTGATVDSVHEQLAGISCGHVSWNSDGRVVKSVPDGIAVVLESFMGDNMLQVYKERSNTVSDKMCACGGMMFRYDGCETCEACGAQECG